MVANAKTISALIFLGLAVTGLEACGGGGGSNDDGKVAGPISSGDEIVIQPPKNGEVGNRPPIVLGKRTIDITMTVGESYPVVVGLGARFEEHFEDPDSDVLKYTVTSDNPSVADEFFFGDLMGSGSDVFKIHAYRTGTAVLTWTARDSEGLTAEKVFYVTVTSEGIDPDERRPTDGSGTVRFEISDGCNDGYGVEYRFFQYPYSGAAPTGVWPREYTEYYNKTYLSSLSCTAGHLVCFGGRTGNARSWGVGFEGDQSCVGKKACCLTCPSGNATSSMSKQLTCK